MERSQFKLFFNLQTGQEQLHTMATDTVRRLFESQQELLVTHEALKTDQVEVFTSVADNVKQLQQEKALIAAGNQELAKLAEKIRAELSECLDYFSDYVSFSSVQELRKVILPQRSAGNGLPEVWRTLAQLAESHLLSEKWQCSGYSSKCLALVSCQYTVTGWDYCQYTVTGWDDCQYTVIG